MKHFILINLRSTDLIGIRAIWNILPNCFN